MDRLATLPTTERRIYFEQAAEQSGRMTAQLIEKDFWVCWSLKQLFSLDDFRDHLTFKGGTSLSKVYQAIERFSEDVDLSIDRGFLGFDGANDPEEAPSSKEQRRRITKLHEACQAVIHIKLAPQLRNVITVQLGEDQAWSLQPDSTDPDNQTLLFQFPVAVESGLSPYFAASVKLEFGARSDHFPVEQAGVTPYVADAFPDAISDQVAPIRVLGAERTFWEKATILHMLHHWPDGKPVTPRMSRHCYDLVRLAQSAILDLAMEKIALLDRVSQHKGVYFKSGWANYEAARPGSLRLVPGKRIKRELQQDYNAMQPMFFEQPPDFDTILDELRELESRINSTSH